MLPEGWIPHRRADGETVGWIELDGDDVAAFDLLGRRVTAPGADWHEAEQALERRGIGYLAEQYTLTLPDDTFVPVRVGEATVDRVTVVEDEFGAASAVGAEPRRHVLPFPVPAGLLRDYVRPRVDIGTWPDASGKPIDYGAVYWGDAEPPAEVYSTCAHPERFEPVVTVARALVDHLERTYDVDRTEEGTDGRQRITLTPRGGGGAPLTMLFPLRGLPGVELEAGFRYRDLWPDCGCDACDDSVPDLLDDFETMVFAVVEGTMSEWRSEADGSEPWKVNVRFEGLTEQSEGSDGGPEPLDVPTEPRRWGAWPLRVG